MFKKKDTSSNSHVSFRGCVFLSNLPWCQAAGPWKPVTWNGKDSGEDDDMMTFKETMALYFFLYMFRHFPENLDDVVSSWFQKDVFFDFLSVDDSHS